MRWEPLEVLGQGSDVLIDLLQVENRAYTFPTALVARLSQGSRWQQ